MNAETIEKEAVRIPSSNDFAEYVTRAEVEDLLYHEAELLDTWQLHDWLALFTEDGTYYVPSTDLPRNASADDSLFYIADDPVRLRERVIRLMKKTAHSEYPRSRTRHLVSNVRIRAREGDTLKVSAAFITYRANHGRQDVYAGTLYYTLKVHPESLRIAEKRAVLASEGLREQSRVSIIL